jgi:hypothetical protein
MYLSCPSVRNLSAQPRQVNFKVSGLAGLVDREVVADTGVIAGDGDSSVAVDAKLNSVFAEPGVALD